MHCHSCGRQFADGAAFCPFCGAKPAPLMPATARPEEHEVADKTVALNASELGIGIDPEDEADEKTVALDAAAMGLMDLEGPEEGDEPPEPDEEAEEPAEKTVALDAAAMGLDLPEQEDRTVAMQLPPDFFADDDDETGDEPEPPGEAPRRRSETILGHPGVSVPSPDRGADATPVPQPLPTARPASIDPFGATLESSALAGPPAAAAPAFSPVSPKATQATPPSQPPARPLDAGRPIAGPAASAPGPAATSRPMPSAPGAQRPPTGGGGIPKAAIIGGVIGLAVVLLIVVLVVALRSGGGGGSAAQSYIPAKVDAAGVVSVGQLRESWIYGAFSDEIGKALKESDDVSDFTDETGLDIERISALAFGARTGEPPSFAAVVTGELDREKNEPKLKDELAGDKSKRVHEVAGHTFYGRKKGEVAGFVGDTTAVMGSSLKMVESMVQAHADGVSVDSDEELAPVLQAIDSKAAVWLVARVSDELLALAPREAQAAGSIVKEGDRVGLSVAVGGDLVVTGVLMLGGDDAEKRAEALVEQATGAIKSAQGMLDDALDELPGDDLPKDKLEALAKGVLEAVTVTADGGTVTLVVTVAQDLLEPLVEDAKKQLKNL